MSDKNKQCVDGEYDEVDWAHKHIKGFDRRQWKIKHVWIVTSKGFNMLKIKHIKKIKDFPK